VEARQDSAVLAATPPRRRLGAGGRVLAAAVEVAQADSAGGVLLRRVLPLTVAIPVGAGWLCVVGQRAGLYNAKISVAIVVAATVAVLVTAISRAAMRLHKVDEQRKDLTHNLESIVAARTAELASTMEALRQEGEQRRAASAALLDVTERFRRSFEGAPIGMAVVDGGGMFLEVNDSLALIFGYSEVELLTMGFLELIDGTERAATEDGFRSLLAGTPRKIRNERRFLHADGHAIWAVVAVAGIYDVDGLHRYNVAQIEDVTAIRNAHETLTHRALHDPLTDLPNRTLFLDRLGHALSRRSRRPGSVAVLFVDLDRFKAVNDSLGHEAGDEALREVGRRLSVTMRPSDTVARIGGDEFVILAEEVGGEADAVNVAERLRAALSVPIAIGNAEIVITSSIGLVVAHPGHHTSEDLLRDADTAMYRAKQRGKDRHEVFTDVLRRAVTDRVSVERHVRSAIKDGAFTVHYQPILELSTGRVESVEALVRLNNPDGSLLAPDRFIGVAEDCGLIVQLGAAVFAEACRQQRTWIDRLGPDAPDRVAVNISARELARHGLLEDIQSTLEDSGLDGHRICIELTESTIMEATPSVLKTIGELKNLGVSLSLDDFGTGYSSLTYLKSFPVDTVKIDRSFVSGLAADPDDRAIVEAVMSLARTLGLAVIAEGVETEEQADALRDLGCGFAQGYLWARPLAAEQLERLLLEPAFDRPGIGQPSVGMVAEGAA
jgi:diguanylate cyclase (GGDEF)-like protein/PAS domain S-box-containing protein